MRFFLKMALSLVFLAQGLVASQQPVESVESLFEQGNTAYRGNEYDRAIELYKDVLELGYESGPLYYNLGNAFYKQGRLGEARLFYEKARLHMPADEALLYNLELLERRLVDQIEPAPRFFLAEWWDAFIGWLPFTMLKTLVTLFFIIFLIVFALYIHRRRRGRGGWRRTMLAGAFIWLAAVVLLVNKAYFMQSETGGVIMDPKATAYAGPAENSTELFVLHEGTRIQVLRQANDWLEVKLADGKTGWIRADNIEFI